MSSPSDARLQRLSEAKNQMRRRDDQHMALFSLLEIEVGLRASNDSPRWRPNRPRAWLRDRLGRLFRPLTAPRDATARNGPA